MELTLASLSSGSFPSINIKAFWLLVGLDNQQLALHSLPKQRSFEN